MKIKPYIDIIRDEIRQSDMPLSWRLKAVALGQQSPALIMMDEATIRDRGFVSLAKQSRRISKGPFRRLDRFFFDKITHKLWLDRVAPELAPPMLYHFAGARLIPIDRTAIPALLSDLPSIAVERGGLFVKPSDRGRAIGAIRVEPVAAGLMVNGALRDGADWIRDLEGPKFAGYTVSALIEPDAWSASFYPGVLNTLRVLTGTHADHRTVVLAATMKMARSSSYPTDNWKVGRGGIAAAVDLATGRLGPGLAFDPIQRRRTEHDRHPESGAPIRGAELPNWAALKTTLSELASMLPFPGLSGWDVALTQRGPVVVEANTRPSLHIHHCHGSLRATPEQRAYWAEVRL